MIIEWETSAWITGNLHLEIKSGSMYSMVVYALADHTWVSRGGGQRRKFAIFPCLQVVKAASVVAVHLQKWHGYIGVTLTSHKVLTSNFLLSSPHLRCPSATALASSLLKERWGRGRKETEGNRTVEREGKRKANRPLIIDWLSKVSIQDGCDPVD